MPRAVYDRHVDDRKSRDGEHHRVRCARRANRGWHVRAACSRSCCRWINQLLAVEFVERVSRAGPSRLPDFGLECRREQIISLSRIAGAIRFCWRACRVHALGATEGDREVGSGNTPILELAHQQVFDTRARAPRPAVLARPVQPRTNSPSHRSAAKSCHLTAEFAIMPSASRLVIMVVTFFPKNSRISVQPLALPRPSKVQIHSGPLTSNSGASERHCEISPRCRTDVTPGPACAWRTSDDPRSPEMHTL